MLDYLRNRWAVIVSLTTALFLGTAVAASAAVPSPDAVATSIVNSAGGQLLDTITSVVPVLIPVMLGLWAISWVLGKLGLKRRARV